MKKPTTKVKQCIVYRCANKSNEGGFIGDLCVPCHEFITGNGGIHSTAYKNAVMVVSSRIGKLLAAVIFENKLYEKA